MLNHNEIHFQFNSFQFNSSQIEKHSCITL